MAPSNKKSGPAKKQKPDFAALRLTAKASRLAFFNERRQAKAAKRAERAKAVEEQVASIKSAAAVKSAAKPAAEKGAKSHA